MGVPIQFERATADRWTDVNPVLRDGEPGFEADTGKLKIGDGVTDWNSLPYVGDGDLASVDTLDDMIAVTDPAGPDVGLEFKPPIGTIYRSSGQTIGANTAAFIDFTAPAGAVSRNRGMTITLADTKPIVVPTAGIYAVSCSGRWDVATSSSFRALRIASLNTTPISGFTPGDTGPSVNGQLLDQHVAYEIECAAGASFGVRVQSGDANPTSIGGVYLSVVKIADL